MNYDVGVFTRRRIISPAESYFAVPAGSGGDAGPTAVTWDPANKTSLITLSGSNLIATGTATVPGDAAVRGTFGGTNRRYYAEFTVTDASTAPIMGVGVVDSTYTLGSGYLGADAHSGAYYTNNTTIFATASTGTWTAGSPATGSIIQLAVDLKAPAKTWGKLIADTGWNGSGAPNGAGGTDISTFTGNVYPAFGFYSGSGVMTANFGATAFAGTMPTGYTKWGDPVIPATAVWDAANKTSNVSVSGATATATGTPTANEAVRSTTSHVLSAPTASSKWYAKFQLTRTGGLLGIGVVDSTFSLGSISVGTDSHGIAFLSDGNAYHNGTTAGTWTSSTPATGDTIEIAVDTSTSSLGAYMRLNTGNWNNSGTANPATGVGAIVAGLGSPIYLVAIFQSGTAGSSFQIIDGVSPGGGYNNW